MRIGVISEGHADRAVIVNIITGITKMDASDIIPIRPTYNYDETDKALKTKNFSTLSVIKEECESRDLIDQFLFLDDQNFVVIHIDTAEIEHLGISRPDKKTTTYCEELRLSVINKINHWLKADLSNNILYAIAIEEIDAWILTIYDTNDSTRSASPKEKLGHILSRKGINTTSNYQNYLQVSKPLSKKKEIQKGNFLSRNCSLKAFVNEIEEKVLPHVDSI